jgi:nicotinamidase-related amidase
VLTLPACWRTECRPQRRLAEVQLQADPLGHARLSRAARHAPGAPIFAEDSKTVAFHPDIMPAPHHKTVQKSSVGVFPTTDIDTKPKASGVKTLIATGLMTHACVARGRP